MATDAPVDYSQTRLIGTFRFSYTQWTPEVNDLFDEAWTALSVVDAENRRTVSIFDEPVRINSWRLSFEDDGESLRYGDRLVLVAQTDTNANGGIDDQDETHVFTFHLLTGERRQLTPAGHAVRALEVLDDHQLAATLQNLRDGRPSARRLSVGWPPPS